MSWRELMHKLDDGDMFKEYLRRHLERTDEEIMLDDYEQQRRADFEKDNRDMEGLPGSQTDTLYGF